MLRSILNPGIFTIRRLAAVASLIFMSGCSSPPLVHIPPVVYDRANILSKTTIAAITKLQFPPDVMVLVRTIDKLDLSRGPFVADDFMEAEPYWQTVRPRSFFEGLLLRDRSSSTAIYLLVSRDPQLVQIRFGNNLRLLALRHGLAAGRAHKECQLSPVRQGSDASVASCLNWLHRELPGALSPPWYVLAANGFIRMWGSDLETFTLSASFSSVSILRLYGYCSARAIEAIEKGLHLIAGTDLRRILSLVFSTAMLHWIFKGLITIILLMSLLLVPGKLIRILLFAAAAILTLLLFVPAVGTVTLLSSGRIEDELFARSLGIDPASGLITVDLFSRAPTVFTAIAMFVVYSVFRITKLDYFRYLYLSRLDPGLQRNMESAQSNSMLNFEYSFLGVEAEEYELRPYRALAHARLYAGCGLLQFERGNAGSFGWLAFFVCAPLAVSLYLMAVCLIGIPVYFARSVVRLISDRKLARRLSYQAANSNANSPGDAGKGKVVGPLQTNVSNKTPPTTTFKEPRVTKIKLPADSREWFLARDGQQHGPISAAEMDKIIELGYLLSTDLVWRVGFSEWRPAGAVFALKKD